MAKAPDQEKAMRCYDIWIASLCLLILAACWSAEHRDVPDKAEVVPKIEATPPPTPTPLSACEIENESLRAEADLWRDKYFQLNCNLWGDDD